MIQIVNETDSSFLLVTKPTTNGELELGISNKEETCFVPLCSIDDTIADAVVEKMRAEQKKDKAEIHISANRTTKFFPPTKQNHINLYCGGAYKRKTLLSKKCGLDSKEYYHAKSLVVVITDAIFYKDGGRETPQLTPFGCSEVYYNKTDSITVKSRHSRQYNEWIDTVCIDVYECQVTKWDKLSPIYIVLPGSGELLKFGTITIHKEEKDTIINALIRCNETGEPIIREPKKPKTTTTKANKGKRNKTSK